MLLFGLAGLFAKWIHLPAIGITFGRVLFSSLALGIYLLAGKQSFRLASRRDLLFLLCAGAVLTIMNKSITASSSVRLHLANKALCGDNTILTESRCDTIKK